jgi:xanthine dehydrogenase small subunit
MIEFILNDKKITTHAPKGSLLVDYIREASKLTGTKTACREGDCGSCTVIEGVFDGKQVKYRAIASCITPLINVHGKHIVTIEGLSGIPATPIQQALIDAAAIQCGYCTPGIVLSLTAYALSNTKYSFEAAKDAIAGNICRCTGYKSIEKALLKIVSYLNQLEFENRYCHLINNAYLPCYFCEIPEKLAEIKKQVRNQKSTQIVGGGTDLFVQKPDSLYNTELRNLSANRNTLKIKKSYNNFKIGASCKISDLIQNHDLKIKIPKLEQYLKLIGSELIRNMATVGGNLANASPIGDLSIIFIALDANLSIVSDRKTKRQVLLKDFFKAYKQIDLLENEYIESVNFSLPEKKVLFNFEKVSKREFLDIASVNSAMRIVVEKELITQVHNSVGGVAPIPLYLTKTCDYLIGKPVEIKLIKKAAEILDSEISPIDDVRGSATYKRLLARQLFFAHFIELFQNRLDISQLVTLEKS